MQFLRIALRAGQPVYEYRAGEWALISGTPVPSRLLPSVGSHVPDPAGYFVDAPGALGPWVIVQRPDTDEVVEPSPPDVVF